MTGRNVPSAEVLLDRRTARVANINGRSTLRVGYAGAKLSDPVAYALFLSLFLLHRPHVP